MHPNKLPIWGGIECTINRIEDTWLDQLEMCGHYKRENDLESIAALGIKTLRYPVLWEYHQPEEGRSIDFSWSDKQLNKLKELGITPVVGLIHHGSGPAFTNLLDEHFPEKLAAYASNVAQQFPWVEYYTPVNEPLTTARFSGLYGLWYPHKKNDVSFLKMLLNQIKGVVLSMQAIRKVNPDAKLVQTEDLGKTYSTALLSYQARFENHRRWLTYDLLCGKVVKDHPLWNYFKRLGLTDSLQFFIDNVMTPDIIGVNHYITSERFLDENIENYPASTHGGNSVHTYADIEAIRVKHHEPYGFRILMKEIWDRYQIPLVVTEAHLHCAREEQLKWFNEIYDCSTELLNEGVDIKAVTSWSLFGAYGWNQLLSSTTCEYERGAFDISAGNVRPTAMAGLLRTLIEKGSFESPVINMSGWWKSESRYFSKIKSQLYTQEQYYNLGQPILIIGKRGTLGKAFARICESRSLSYILLSREDLDICNYDDIERIIANYNPWAIINAAGYVRVDNAETDKQNCYRENTKGPQQLARACRRYGIQLMTFSSDMVFDGEKKTPYFESDKVNPINIYGSSKAKAEEFVIREHPSSLIIRTSAFFGPWDSYNFISCALRQLDQGQKLDAASDITISPTYIPHLVNAALDLLIDDENGIWHITNNDQVTWYEFAREAATRAGKDTELIIPVKEMHWQAKRPAYSVLQSEKGVMLPSLEIALNEFFHERIVETRVS